MRRVLVLLLLLSSCGGGEPTAPAKYQQTWAKSYRETTCSEWSGSMTPSQRFAAGADMLVGARSRDGATTMPSDATVESFVDDVSEACSANGAVSVAEIGAVTYLIDRPRYGP